MFVLIQNRTMVEALAAQIKNKPVCCGLFREGSGLDGASGEGTSL